MNRQNPMKIVIIDDDQRFSEKMKNFLKQEFTAKIKLFNCGNDFMDFAQQQDMDLVIIEHTIMDGKGKEIIRQIINLNKDIKVIIMSLKNEVKTIVELIRQGVHDFISKSNIDFDIVKASVEKAINERDPVESVFNFRLNSRKVQRFGLNAFLLGINILIAGNSY